MRRPFFLLVLAAITSLSFQISGCTEGGLCDLGWCFKEDVADAYDIAQSGGGWGAFCDQCNVAGCWEDAGDGYTLVCHDEYCGHPDMYACHDSEAVHDWYVEYCGRDPGDSGPLCGEPEEVEDSQIDTDGDGWCADGQDMNSDGDCADSGESLAPGDNGDCDDDNTYVSPSEPFDACCDGVDNECNGYIDDNPECGECAEDGPELL